jgi:hypothetical protein
MMKCGFHPDRDATARCADCGAPLCDGCAGREAEPVCTRCAAVQAVADFSLEAEQRRQEQIHRAEADEKRRRGKGRGLLWLLAGIAVLGIAANAMLYLRYPSPSADEFIPEKHPVAAAVVVDAAVKDYIGRYGEAPENLYSLEGSFLAPGLLTPQDFQRYDYRKTPSGGYELRIREKGSGPVPDLVFTKGGPQP